MDYFSKDEILDNTHIFCENCRPKNKFSAVRLFELPSSFKTYSSINFIIQNDKKYIIHGIEAVINYGDNIDGCYKKLDELDKELSTLFIGAKRYIEHRKILSADKSGKSTMKQISYDFKSGDVASISCTDWSSKMNYPDVLRVSLSAAIGYHPPPYW